MEILILLALAVGVIVLKNREQQQRIALLGSVLSRFEIEKLMETLMDGYLRALGEERTERQAQVWSFLDAQEVKLRDQFQAFAAEFSKEDAALTRVSKLPVAVPFATTLFPAATFDLRQAFAIHAQAIGEAVDNQAQKHQPLAGATLLPSPCDHGVTGSLVGRRLSNSAALPA